MWWMAPIMQTPTLWLFSFAHPIIVWQDSRRVFHKTNKSRKIPLRKSEIALSLWQYSTKLENQKTSWRFSEELQKKGHSQIKGKDGSLWLGKYPEEVGATHNVPGIIYSKFRKMFTGIVWWMIVFDKRNSVPEVLFC